MGSTRVSRFILVAVVVGLSVWTTGMSQADIPFAKAYPFAGPDGVVVKDIIGFADSWGAANGGEFVVTNITQPSNTAFTTFCVQLGEYLSWYPPNTFEVVGISDKVLVATGNATKDNLQSKTAFLFSKFRAGTLAGFDYLDAASQRTADADLLQRAIWQYQGQVTTETTDNNKFYKYAEDNGWTSGVGDVRVLNIVWQASQYTQYPTGTPAQDVLTIVPIPEPVFLQFGVLSGLGGFALWRRRR